MNPDNPALSAMRDRILLGWLTLVLTACRPAETPQPPIEAAQPPFIPPDSLVASRPSWLRATLNGKSWQSDSARCYHYLNRYCQDGSGFITIYFYVFNRLGYLREQINFGQVPYHTGKFAVYPSPNAPSCRDSLFSNFFTLEADGDVVKDGYKAVANESLLRLTYYNQRTGELRGEFNLTLKAVSKQGPYLYPDTLRFQNATFRTWITRWNVK